MNALNNASRFQIGNDIARKIDLHDSKSDKFIKIKESLDSKKNLGNSNNLRLSMLSWVNSMSFKDDLPLKSGMPNVEYDFGIKILNSEIKECIANIDLSDSTFQNWLNSIIEEKSPYNKFKFELGLSIVVILGQPYWGSRQINFARESFKESEDYKELGREYEFQGLKPECTIFDLVKSHEFKSGDWDMQDILALGDFGEEVKLAIKDQFQQKTLMYNSLAVFGFKLTNYSLNSDNIIELSLSYNQQIVANLILANNLYDSRNNQYNSILQKR